MNSIAEQLARPGAWLTIGVNALPLIGVFWLGWDVTTLVLLYWCETGIIGLWVIVRLLLERGKSRAAGRLAGPGLALFILVHAGIFMSVHLFFISFLLVDPLSGPGGNEIGWIDSFLARPGVWLPLAGFFIVRGLTMVMDRQAGVPVGQTIAGFYLRIVIMQGTIIIGGMLAMFWPAEIMLVLLVLLKTLADFGAGIIAGLTLVQKRRPA